MLQEHSIEMRGRPHRDFEEYFHSIGGKQVGKGKYEFSNWNVELSDENHLTMGSLDIPTTIVTFRVEEEHWSEIFNAFNLHFLSAGA